MEPAVGMSGLDKFAGFFRIEGQLPVFLRDECLDLLLAVDNHPQRRALYSPNREDVLPAPPCGKRDEAGEGGTPHQVDRLPGFPGCSKGKVEFGGVGKCMLEFLFCDGREPGPVHGDFCVHGPDEFEGLFPDQFPFRIKVGGNRDPVGFPCQFLEEGDNPFFGRHLDGFGIDQAPRGILLAPPVLVSRFEIDLHHMAPESDRGDVTKTVCRDAGVLVLGKFLPFPQDLRNTACRDILFRNNQVHGRFKPPASSVLPRAGGSVYPGLPSPGSFS